jgi:translation initiation factor IF-2
MARSQRTRQGRGGRGRHRNGSFDRPSPRREVVKFAGPVDLPAEISVAELAEVIRRSPIEIIKELMRLNMMVAMNDSIDFEVAATISVGLGVRVRKPVDVEESEASDRVGLDEEEGKARPRPAVVAVMGHVDHGKTTLLDAIRGTNVVGGEAGGITQSIGAYQIDHEGQLITFIDTPGHEAFTAMRARGAQATDIAVIVVAADDGVMPQTVEAINHAKAAQVPMIIAVNKIDVAGADPVRVATELLEHDIIVEDLGGEVLSVRVSALKGDGVSDLIDSLLLLSEVSEFSADPKRDAIGVVVEATLDKQRGPVATVIVRSGTVNIGDTIVAGDKYGHVRRMVDGFGKEVASAGPSVPVEILGLNGVPESGQQFEVVEDEKVARQRIDARARQEQRRHDTTRPSTLAQVLRHRQSYGAADLNLVAKTGAQGTIDAIRRAVDGLSTPDVQVKLLHAATGPVSESDVMLASASEAMIVGFETSVEPAAARLANQESVPIKTYDIIYTMIDDVKQAARQMTEPEQEVVTLGRATVLEVFQHGRRERIAGVRVTTGMMRRSARMILSRRGEELFEGAVSSMRHFDDNVREIATNYEGGIVLDGFHDYEEGDIITCYETRAVAAR